MVAIFRPSIIQFALCILFYTNFFVLGRFKKNNNPTSIFLPDILIFVHCDFHLFQNFFWDFYRFAVNIFWHYFQKRKDFSGIFRSSWKNAKSDPITTWSTMLKIWICLIQDMSGSCRYECTLPSAQCVHCYYHSESEKELMIYIREYKFKNYYIPNFHTHW